MRARAIGGCREVQKMKNLSLVNLVTSRDLARSRRVPGVFRQAPAWGNRALAEACIMQGCSGKIAQVRHCLPQQRNEGTAVDLPVAGEQECKMDYGRRKFSDQLFMHVVRNVCCSRSAASDSPFVRPTAN